MTETNKTLEERLRALRARVPDTEANTSVREEMNSVIHDRLMKLPPDGPADPDDITRVEGWETQFLSIPPDRPDEDRERHTEREEPERQPDREPLEERPAIAKHSHWGLILLVFGVSIVILLLLFFMSRDFRSIGTAVKKTMNKVELIATTALDTANHANATATNAYNNSTGAHTRVDSLNSRVGKLEADMGTLKQRLDAKDSLDAYQGQTLAEFRGRLDGHDAQLREFRAQASALRDSVLGRLPAVEGSGKRAPAPVAPVAPKVETTDVAKTSGPTTEVTLQNKLNVNVRVAYESWNRTLSPNGQIVLNLPPGEVFKLVVSNLQNGEGWVIPVDAANQHKVEIPPR
jgi:hypothetical protein